MIVKHEINRTIMNIVQTNSVDKIQRIGNELLLATAADIVTITPDEVRIENPHRRVSVVTPPELFLKKFIGAMISDFDLRDHDGREITINRYVVVPDWSLGYTSISDSINDILTGDHTPLAYIEEMGDKGQVSLYYGDGMELVLRNWVYNPSNGGTVTTGTVHIEYSGEHGQVTCAFWDLKYEHLLNLTEILVGVMVKLEDSI